jgi:tRNA(fMet)-specific endonuclease VapC
MENVLVDSDIIIDYFRGFEPSREFFKSAFEKGNLFLSVVSVAEIYSGKDTRNPAKEHAIKNFLNNFQIAVVTSTIAKSAGELKRDFDIPFADAIIAATALEYNFKLATRNIKHFNKIRRLNILKPY